jgi:flagellar P-ring protein precursor FlgI
MAKASNNFRLVVSECGGIIGPHRAATWLNEMLVVALVILIGGASPVWAVKIADITRIAGQRTNVLTGLGLVMGLKGTGDGGKYLPAIRPLAAMLGKFNDPTTVDDLSDGNNVALVSIIATVPADGVREGDRIDVNVMSLGAATSLKGGRLFVTPMTGPVPGPVPSIFALAEGAIVIEDPTTPTVGAVKGGAVMEADLPAKFIDNGKFCLVIEDPSASWTTSSTIAKIINDAESTNGENIATAIDPKNVEVTIPAIERDRPDSFISRVQRLPVPILPTEARVEINDRTGTMIITGDVEISPVVITHQGLSISTFNPPPTPLPGKPVVETHDVIAMDTTHTGDAKLQDLVDALDRIKVPTEDKIEIVKELYKVGKLHAKLIVD